MLVTLGVIPSRKITCSPNHVAKRSSLHFSANRLLCLLWLSNGALCVDSSPSLRSRRTTDLGPDPEGGKLVEQLKTLELLRQEVESGFTGLASKLSALTSIGSSDSCKSETCNHVSRACMILLMQCGSQLVM